MLTLIFLFIALVVLTTMFYACWQFWVFLGLFFIPMACFSAYPGRLGRDDGEQTGVAIVQGSLLLLYGISRAVWLIALAVGVLGIGVFMWVYAPRMREP